VNAGFPLGSFNGLERTKVLAVKLEETQPVATATGPGGLCHVVLGVFFLLLPRHSEEAIPGEGNLGEN
jgi:hypothetical protein